MLTNFILDNDIGMTGIEALCKVLPNSTLTSLALNSKLNLIFKSYLLTLIVGNTCGNDGIPFLVEVLPYSCLTCLNLGSMFCSNILFVYLMVNHLLTLY